MAEHWHLTPQTGDVKGNNPYQLNRMTVDSSFRAPTIGYNLANIQGYSATGDVILKGNQLSPKPAFTPANPGPGPSPSPSPNPNPTPCQQGGARHHHRHHSQIQQHQVQSQSQNVQSQSQVAQIQQTHGYARPDFTPTVTMTTVESGINSGTTDWQQAFSTRLTQSHMDHLNDLTEARYKAIMGETGHY